MSNLSYCRFQNTLDDLNECLDAIENGEIAASEDEYEARAELISVCQFIAKNFGHLKNELYADVYCEECGDVQEECCCDDEGEEEE